MSPKKWMIENNNGNLKVYSNKKQEEELDYGFILQCFICAFYEKEFDLTIKGAKIFKSNVENQYDLQIKIVSTGNDPQQNKLSFMRMIHVVVVTSVTIEDIDIKGNVDANGEYGNFKAMFTTFYNGELRLKKSIYGLKQASRKPKKGVYYACIQGYKKPHMHKLRSNHGKAEQFITTFSTMHANTEAVVIASKHIYIKYYKCLYVNPEINTHEIQYISTWLALYPH
ncbi:hypothetical protein ACJX0J_016832, partial [Zea mays]